MAYTPINWATGDTITADKLNKMDNGWGVENAQLFSETVTTSQPPFGGMSVGTLVYSGTEYPDSLSITFDGTEYECQPIDGAYVVSGVFSLYMVPEGVWKLSTPNAGTYSISAVGAIAQVSPAFDAIVKKCSNASLLPLPCINGVTTFDDFNVAFFGENRLVYVPLGNDNGTCHIVTGITQNAHDATLTLLPAPDGFTATFTDGVFTINWS